MREEPAHPADAPAAASRTTLFDWDATLEVEDVYKAQGREAGLREGQERARESGRAEGLRQGTALGQELGWYWGCSLVWEALVSASRSTPAAAASPGTPPDAMPEATAADAMSSDTASAATPVGGSSAVSQSAQARVASTLGRSGLVAAEPSGRGEGDSYATLRMNAQESKRDGEDGDSMVSEGPKASPGRAQRVAGGPKGSLAVLHVTERAKRSLMQLQSLIRNFPLLDALEEHGDESPDAWSIEQHMKAVRAKFIATASAFGASPRTPLFRHVDDAATRISTLDLDF